MVYPSQLKQYTEEVTHISGLNEFEERWVKTLDVILKINVESSPYKILISEGVDASHVILLELISQKNNHSISLFNGKKEGYEALIIEDYNHVVFGESQELKDEENKCLFTEVYLWFNYNIDLEEESENGVITTIDNQKQSVSDVYERLFDSFGIVTKNEWNNTHVLLEIELA